MQQGRHEVKPTSEMWWGTCVLKLTVLVLQAGTAAGAHRNGSTVGGASSGQCSAYLGLTDSRGAHSRAGKSMIDPMAVFSADPCPRVKLLCVPHACAVATLG